MLLHGGKGDEVIKSFFNEVYAYYVKVNNFSLCFMRHLDKYECLPELLPPNNQ